MNPLNPSGRAPVVTAVSGFDAFVVDEDWPWARQHAEEIAAHWARAQADKPALFDGQVLVARRMEIAGGVWRAAHIVIPYSALKYWLSLGFVEAGAFNTFASGVVVTADGAVLLGRMGGHTANAGRLYFPCGTPDCDDLDGDVLDVEGSMTRELGEETGLGAGQITATEQRWIVQDGPLVCCARRFDSTLTAAEMERFVTAHLAADPQPELDGVLLVRGARELDGLPAQHYARALVDTVLA
jgi:8-oxo-dGTP pyrophosphatase MutT (NUDIX family)